MKEYAIAAEARAEEERRAACRKAADRPREEVVRGLRHLTNEESAPRALQLGRFILITY